MMDIDTLNSLKQAYQNAPSPELAKVIVLGLFKMDRLREGETYLSAARSVFSADEALSLGENLYQNQSYRLALLLLDDSVPAQALIAAKCEHGLGNLEKARNFYLSLIEERPAWKDEEIERLLEIQDREDIAEKPVRPKLRVVEKVPMAEVTDLVRYRQSTTKFDDVVGLEAIKKQINKKIIMPFQRPSLFQKFKKKIGGGVLLYGPPGCGKTLLARATAGECNAEFFNVEISDVLDMYIGESEQKLNAIFEKARAQTPSVLFFDEIEALAGKREHSRNSTTSNLVSQFLTELDGFSQNNRGVLVLASTNVPWAVDAAFLRPGRFDRMFFVPPPDKVARQAILEHHMKGRPGEGGIDFEPIATRATGYSGADLYNLIEMAADEAIDESLESGTEVTIGLHHFERALKESRATTTEWLTTARNYARYANDGGRYDDVLSFLKQHGK